MPMVSPRLGTLDPYDRQATNLVLTAGGNLFGNNNIGLPSQAGQYAVTIGEGASIEADAGAAIGLGSPAQVTVLGSIIAPGGSIVLSADSGNSAWGFVQPGQVAASFTSANKSVWLGADAVLDVAGIALTNPFATPDRGLLALPTTGKVLNGGSVALSDETGYVVTQAGSTIDVSGTSASLDEVQAGAGRLGAVDEAPQQVWSDAGSITLAACNGLYFDGTIEAHAGAPLGEGGTLTILPEVMGNGGTAHNKSGTLTTTFADGTSAKSNGTQGIILQQGANLLPNDLAPGANISASPTGDLIFSADELKGSGVGTLIIGGNAGVGNVPVAFAGSIDLTLNNAVVINAPQLIALPAGATSFSSSPAYPGNSIGAPTVSISAPYVAINGGNQTQNVTVFTPTNTPALADGTLNLSASFIDLENQFDLAGFRAGEFYQHRRYSAVLDQYE